MLVRLEYNTQEYVLWKLLPLNNIHHIVAFTVCGTTSTRHSVRIEPQYAWLCPSLYINSQIHKFKPSSTLWTSQPQQKTFHNNTHVRVVQCTYMYSCIFKHFSTSLRVFSSVQLLLFDCLHSFRTYSFVIFFLSFFSHFFFFLIFSYFSCCWFAASGAIVRCWYIFFCFAFNLLFVSIFGSSTKWLKRKLVHMQRMTMKLILHNFFLSTPIKETKKKNTRMECLWNCTHFMNLFLV